MRKDAEELLNVASCAAKASQAADDIRLTLGKVYEFAHTAKLDDIRFILDAKKLNEAASAAGLRENYGHQLGKTLCSPLGHGIMGDSIFSRILSAQAVPATHVWREHGAGDEQQRQRKPGYLHHHAGGGICQGEP